MADNECMRWKPNLECMHSQDEAKDTEKSIMVKYHAKKINATGKCKSKGRLYKTIFTLLFIITFYDYHCYFVCFPCYI